MGQKILIYLFRILYVRIVGNLELVGGEASLFSIRLTIDWIWLSRHVRWEFHLHELDEAKMIAISVYYILAKLTTCGSTSRSTNSEHCEDQMGRHTVRFPALLGGSSTRSTCRATTLEVPTGQYFRSSPLDSSPTSRPQKWLGSSAKRISQRWTPYLLGVVEVSIEFRPGATSKFDQVSIVVCNFKARSSEIPVVTVRFRIQRNGKVRRRPWYCGVLSGWWISFLTRCLSQSIPRSMYPTPWFFLHQLPYRQSFWWQNNHFGVDGQIGGDQWITSNALDSGVCHGLLGFEVQKLHQFPVFRWIPTFRVPAEAGVSGFTEGRGKRHWCLPVRASSWKIQKVSSLSWYIIYTYIYIYIYVYIYIYIAESHQVYGQHYII